MFKTLGCLIGSMLIGAVVLSLSEPDYGISELPAGGVETSADAVSSIADTTANDWNRVVVRWAEPDEPILIGGSVPPPDESTPGDYHFVIRANGAVIASRAWREQASVGSELHALHVVLTSGRIRNRITRLQGRALSELLAQLREQCHMEFEQVELLRPPEDERFAMLAGPSTGFRDMLLSVGLTR